VRVVAGEARGRRLVAPEGRDTRPTLDRVREALFNTLGSLGAVEDSRVADLFAGSGALGIEALSRGAESCVFVDQHRGVRQVIEENLRVTGLADRAEIVASPVAAWLFGVASDRPPFDLVLLDPPYSTDDDEWAVILEGVGAVAPGGFVVVESDRRVPVPDGWGVRKEKKYGGTLVSVLQPPATTLPTTTPEFS
jgi:16S rRNA (guanine966-N2)-methyltransferase